MDPAAPTPSTLASPVVLPVPKRRTAIRPQPAVTAPVLSVVIVNYREWRSTAALARQVLRATAQQRDRVEVLVVDNHSPAHPLAARLRRWPRLSLRRWGRNRGFARAANEGSRLSRGEWVLLLNPDVTLPDGFLDGVQSLIERLPPRAGIVGFGLRNSDGSPQLSCGPFPTLANTLTRLALPRERRKCRPVRAGHFCPVPWVTGCCLLARRECLRDVGGFDEEFFLYYEDVDLCQRAHARGWSVSHEPRLQAIHHAPLHARRVSPTLRLITRHALLTYASRHWPAWQLPVLSAIVRTEARVRRWWALRHGDQAAASQFRELAALASDMAAGHPERARSRLRRVVRRAEAAGGVRSAC